jgi:hypothetical protein
MTETNRFKEVGCSEVQGAINYKSSIIVYHHAPNESYRRISVKASKQVYSSPSAESTRWGSADILAHKIIKP